MDRYYLQLNNVLEVDIKGLSDKNGYNIEKIDFYNKKIHTCFTEILNIDRIIYIGKIKKENNLSQFWKKVFEEDRENLLPHYLCTWCENMDYWTKRIGNIQIKRKTKKCELNIYSYLKKIPITILNNRLNIKEMNKYLLYDK